VRVSLRLRQQVHSRESRLRRRLHRVKEHISLRAWIVSQTATLGQEAVLCLVDPRSESRLSEESEKRQKTRELSSLSRRSLGRCPCRCGKYLYRCCKGYHATEGWCVLCGRIGWTKSNRWVHRYDYLLHFQYNLARSLYEIHCRTYVESFLSLEANYISLLACFIRQVL
jgi:hypothetical protein